MDSQLLKRKAASRPRSKSDASVDARNPPKRPKPSKDVPKTSAQLPKVQSRNNLTLADWMTVYTYVDDHPGLHQRQIVEHFKTLPIGALIFNQSTLARKLSKRSEMEDRVKSYPNALSGKKARSVTRPDVEQALVLWMNHVQEKCLAVTGPLLQEKRSQFEKEFNVPPEEQLTGGSWVQKFCAAYKIRENKRHGEAGSIDLDLVEAERTRCQQLVAKYPRRDRYNVDETSFFP